MINQRMRLSVGASSGQRVLFVVVGLVFAAVGAAFVALPFVPDNVFRDPTGNPGSAGPVEIWEEDPEHWPDEPGLDDASTDQPWWAGGGIGPFRFVGLCGVPVVLLGLAIVLRGLRTAAWLEGSRATVRGAFITRTVDLATANITAGAIVHSRGSDDGYHRVPTLVATEPGTGRRITIPLRGMGLATLPPAELRALADAISAGRSTAGPDADAHNLARQLRTMADNPLPT